MTHVSLPHYSNSLSSTEGAPLVRGIAFLNYSNAADLWIIDEKRRGQHLLQITIFLLWNVLEAFWQEFNSIKSLIDLLHVLRYLKCLKYRYRNTHFFSRRLFDWLSSRLLVYNIICVVCKFWKGIVTLHLSSLRECRKKVLSFFSQKGTWRHIHKLT